MFKYNTVFVFVLLMACLVRSYGQSNSDTINLHTIDITANRISDFTVGNVSNKIDSIILRQYSGENLSSLLKYNSTISIKDYGAAGISTASSRGTAATHTGVSWNGFLINNPNLGLCDLSLIPATIADEITVYTGGSSALNGHGALGGFIALDFKPGFYNHSGACLNGSYGDAGNYNAGLTIHAGNNRITSQTQLFYSNNKNQFLFINRAKKGYPLELLKHAKVNNYGLLQQLAFKLNRNQQINAGVWYQVTTREQPPGMTSSHNEALLTDSIFRLYLTYQHNWNKIFLTVRTAYFNETERYDDPLYNLHSTYIVKSYKGEINGKFFLCSKLQADGGITVNLSDADITEYKNKVIDKRYGFYGGLLYAPLKGLKISFQLRQEISGGSKPPLVPAFGMEYTRWNNLLTVKFTTGKQYNLPSLNDKYWNPGGNPGLQSESAWSGDIGFTLSPDKKRNLKLTAIAYQMLVNNWIQWAPIDSTGLYKAANLKKVCSKGLETSLSYAFNIRKMRVTFSGCMAYTRSITRTSNAKAGEVTQGKQLIYVPLYNGSVSSGICYKGFTLSYQHTFTGKRYILADNTDSLPAFSIGSFYIGKNMPLKEFAAQVYVKIYNPWNEEYQLVKWHAMPLRTISAGISINLNHTKNKIKPN